jgi:transcriptional regulator NrdR family protein
MECGYATEVIETQKFDDFVWRRRRCIKCDHRFSTHEKFADTAQTTRLSTKPKPDQKPKVIRRVITVPKNNITKLPVVNKRRLIESLREELERKNRECDGDTDD